MPGALCLSGSTLCIRWSPSSCPQPGERTRWFVACPLAPWPDALPPGHARRRPAMMRLADVNGAASPLIINRRRHVVHEPFDQHGTWTRRFSRASRSMSSAGPRSRSHGVRAVLLRRSHDRSGRRRSSRRSSATGTRILAPRTLTLTLTLIDGSMTPTDVVAKADMPIVEARRLSLLVLRDVIVVV
jgi:hypothetical protein